MTPLHSHTSVPQHAPQRWWVRKWFHDTRQNQFKTQHCAPGPAQSSHECVGAGFLAAASRCHGGRSTPLNRDGVVTAASQRHRPADPAWACQLVKEALDKAKIQAWFTQRDTTKHVLTHPSLDRKATISDDFSNEFTWIKSFILWFNFYWCLFLRAQLTSKSA